MKNENEMEARKWEIKREIEGGWKGRKSEEG